MIILSSEPHSQYTTHAFEYTIIFEAGWEHRDTVKDEFDISSVCHWVSNTFTHNFVILEYGYTCIAGGCIDNVKAWNEGYDSNRSYLLDKWELRCANKDATLFLLKYSKVVK